MRIIAGEYKGRRLYTLADFSVRPTADKPKGAIFSMLADRIYDATCCDLFAGTGNLGLEALSRGADFCYFGDHSQESIDVVKKNVEMCKAEDRSKIVHGSYLKTLEAIDEKVDIFFLDPPYKKQLLEKSMEAIVRGEKLSEEGVIIAEHGVDKDMPEEFLGLRKIKEKKYGIVVISIYMW